MFHVSCRIRCHTGVDDWLTVDRIRYQKFFFSETSIPALGPSQLPLPWVQGALPPWLKRTESVSDYSQASNAEDRKQCDYVQSHIRHYDVHKGDINFPFNVNQLFISSRCRYSDSLRAGRSGDRIPVGVRFSVSVQTGPGAHPASYTMGTKSFVGVKRPGRGVDQPPPI